MQHAQEMSITIVEVMSLLRFMLQVSKIKSVIPIFEDSSILNNTMS